MRVATAVALKAEAAALPARAAVARGAAARVGTATAMETDVGTPELGPTNHSSRLRGGLKQEAAAPRESTFGQSGGVADRGEKPPAATCRGASDKRGHLIRR